MRKKNPLSAFDEKSILDLYKEGMKKLTSVSFKTKKDAFLALKACIQRAFHTTTALHKKGGTVKSYCVCSQRYKKMKEVATGDGLTYYFSNEINFSEDKCSWSAILVKDTKTKSFYFGKIDPLEAHCLNCFRGTTRKSSELIDLAKYNMEIKSLTRFNDLLANKLGISVTLDDIRRHLHFKKMHDDHLKRDYESLCPAELKETLIHEDRRILGALKSMKDEGRILFDYTTTEDKTKLDYVACLEKTK